MKTLKIILMALTTLVLTACSKSCEPIETKVYIDKPIPYYVKTPCVTEEVVCGPLVGSPIEKQNQTLKCIMDLRKALNSCK